MGVRVCALGVCAYYDLTLFLRRREEMFVLNPCVAMDGMKGRCVMTY